MGRGRAKMFYDEDENKERGNWTGRLDFLLSTIGFAVGLGNIWRFPYKAYANGGASFLIPYIVSLVFAGLPLFFLEMAFGQFASLGPISVWRAVPIFKGLGYAMVVISGLVCIYYNMVIAYVIYYLFASFTSELPWQNCKPEWCEYGCRDRNVTGQNDTCGGMGTKTPSESYWEREILDISESVTDGGDEFRWQLVLCLLLAWVVVFVCLSKGIKSSGKVVYFTATFPYIVLLILLIRNCMLDGAIDGIEFYIIPEWEKLKDPAVWHTAAAQIFYSLGVAFGGLETMASYNRFHNNVLRDAVLVAIINCGTSIFGGFVIFAAIGFMAKQTGQEVGDVATSGPGLLFVAYPEGLAMMPVAPFWSIIFFLMIFTLGLDSQFAMMETVISAFTDEFPWLRKSRRKTAFTFLVCLAFFLIGLPQCARNGVYIMTLFDWYCAGYSLMLVSLLEVIAVSWIYGFRRFSEDIEMMIGSKPNIYWLANWIVITPAFLFFILFYAAYGHSDAYYYGDQVFPDWFQGVGWIMVALAILLIFLVALVVYCQAHDFFKTMRRVLRPKQGWGPALEKHRTGRYAEIEMNQNSRTEYDNKAYDGIQI